MIDPLGLNDKTKALLPPLARWAYQFTNPDSQDEVRLFIEVSLDDGVSWRPYEPV